MALWMVRAGAHGEYELKFLQDNRIYCTWEDLNQNLSTIDKREELQELMQNVYAYDSKGALNNHAAQVWAFVKRINVGDWIVLPSKLKPAIHFAKVISDYGYDPKAPDPYYHYRQVEWFTTDVPRSNFDQDILYSLGAFMTICQIKRNDAEKRIKEMSRNGWKVSESQLVARGDVADVGEEDYDLEQIGRDTIAKMIIRKFKGHGMARLVEGLLKAQGYTTFRSPEGPDKGIDILASSGPLGFGEPRICVQVKSTDTPLDHPTLNQLIGAMQTVGAQQGLLVSWGGFKTSVDREKPNQFFKVRLWNQNDLIDQVLLYYNQLSEDLRTELPLKRIWTVAVPDAEE